MYFYFTVNIPSAKIAGFLAVGLYVAVVAAVACPVAAVWVVILSTR